MNLFIFCWPIINQSSTWWHRQYKAVNDADKDVGSTSALCHPIKASTIGLTKIWWAKFNGADDYSTWPGERSNLGPQWPQQVSVAGMLIPQTGSDIQCPSNHVPVISIIEKKTQYDLHHSGQEFSTNASIIMAVSVYKELFHAHKILHLKNHSIKNNNNANHQSLFNKIINFFFVPMPHANNF